MGKEDKQIIVVPREILFSDGTHFNGFRDVSQVDYETRILENFKAVRRGSTQEPVDHPLGNAERNSELKQPIGYTLVVNPKTKKVFAFKRASKDEHYAEKRLQGKWSWGVGGHIEPCDCEGNILRESMKRELGEEVYIEGKLIRISPIGYINDDEDEVSQVHFGILYFAEIDGTARPKDKEMALGEMINLSQLEEVLGTPECEVESWSKIAIEPLRKILR